MDAELETFQARGRSHHAKGLLVTHVSKNMPFLTQNGEDSPKGTLGKMMRGFFQILNPKRKRSMGLEFPYQKAK